MYINLKSHQIKFDVGTIIVSILIVIWAVYYYYSTLTSSEDGPDTVLFMKPIFIGILICFPFVVWGAISIKPISKSYPEPSSDKSTQDVGFFDKRRIFFVLAVIGYAFAIPFLGYFISSVLFIFVVSYYLGSRNLWVLLFLPISLITFLSLVFSMLLKIPIKIWPPW